MNETYHDELLRTTTERLQHLQLQAAGMGMDTPPHIAIEIQRYQDKLEELRLAGRGLFSLAVIEAMEPAERWQRLYDQIWSIEERWHIAQKSLDADRIRIQERHKEFNIAIQRCTFEIEVINREKANAMKLPPRWLTYNILALMLGLLIGVLWIWLS